MDRWRAKAGAEAKALATAGLFALLALGSCDPATDADSADAALELGKPLSSRPGTGWQRRRKEAS